MARKFWIVGAVFALALLAPCAAAFAAPGYDEAKKVYSDLGEAAEDMEKANKDCVKAGKSAASGVLAWKKSRDLEINKDGWWKKSSLNPLQKTEIELLYKTSYPRFQKAILAGGKECYNDPRFQKALADFKGGDK